MFKLTLLAAGFAAALPAVAETNRTDDAGRPAPLAAGEAPATPAESGESAFRLGEITVTAPRAGGAPPACTAVDAHPLRRRNDQTIGDAMKGLPGVTVGRTGGRNEPMVLVHGFDLRRVPVFIDGVPVYVPYDGYVDVDRFSILNASEIRVERGFASILYGPNTLGGAINMLTRQPTRPLEGAAGVAMEFDGNGNVGAEDAYVNVGTRQGDAYVQGSASQRRRWSCPLPSGFEAAPGEPAQDGLRGNSGGRDVNVRLRVGLIPRDQDEYAATYQGVRSEKGVPPYAGTAAGVPVRYWRFTRWDRDSVYLNSRATPAEGVALKSRLFCDRYANTLDSYDDASYRTQRKPFAFTSLYDDRSYGGSAELECDVGGASVLRTAVLFKDDAHEEHNLGQPVCRFEDQTWSLGSECAVAARRAVVVTAGARYDWRDAIRAQDLSGTPPTVKDLDPEDLDAWNGQVGVTYQSLTSGSLYATCSRSTRLPTLKDRFSSLLGTVVPNPELRAEQSDSYQLGFRGRPHQRLQAETMLFCHDLHDLIQLNSIGSGRLQAQNVGRARTTGFEAAGGLRLLDTLEIGASYTRLDCENLSDPEVRITDAPEHQLHAFAEWRPLSGLSLRPDLDVETGRDSSSDGLRTTGAFTVWNIAAAYERRGGVEIRAGVKNLADTAYAYAEGYPEPGRRFYAGCSFSF